MLVVEDKIESEAVVANQKSINIDEYIWPHGITPPLHHVRKRRFRKRVNKRVSLAAFVPRNTQLIVFADDRDRGTGSRTSFGGGHSSFSVEIWWAPPVIL